MSKYIYSFNYDEENKLLTINCAQQSHIDSITWPSGMRELHIFGDYIDHLEVPEGVEIVICCRLGLKTITLPDSLEFLYCNDNFLKTVELPEKIMLVELEGNYLESVSFRKPPTDLMRLHLLKNDRLMVLDFEPPKTLGDLRVTHWLKHSKDFNPKFIDIINENMEDGCLDIIKSKGPISDSIHGCKTGSIDCFTSVNTHDGIYHRIKGSIYE